MRRKIIVLWTVPLLIGAGVLVASFQGSSVKPPVSSSPLVTDPVPALGIVPVVIDSDPVVDIPSLPADNTKYPKPDKWIALMFDDGPSNPEHTRAVLSVLAQYKVKATFFMLGDEVQEHPRTFMQVVSSGHKVANHGWDHTNMTTLTNAQIRSQLSLTQSIFGKYKTNCMHL